MKRPEYNEDEWAVVGEYAALESAGRIGNPPEIRFKASPRYNRPITPKENWKLLLSGKKPYWIPTIGVGECEMKKFRPRIHPDSMANHQLYDGEPEYPFETESDVRKGWFDTEWIFVYQVGGATVKPGAPQITNINKWEEMITFPDIDSYDWENCAKKNDQYIHDDDRPIELGIQCSFWERLMAFMDVDKAAMALIDEEQQEGVHRLFDKLADFYIQYISKAMEYLDIDMVELHDDWGHQNGPFFSLDTAREMIVPYLKRVTDYCHSRGLFFELHSCGNNKLVVPGFIEAGVDVWCGQPNINDIATLAKEYKNEKMVFGITPPEEPEGATEEEIRRIAGDWVNEFKDCHVAINTINPIGTAKRQFTPQMHRFLYEYSRKAYLDVTD